MERRVPVLTTELEHKPIDKDRLAEVLGGFSCEPEGCRLQECFQDREHLISTNEAQGAAPLSEVESLLRTHPGFIVDAICRWKHMRINVTWTRSEPISDDFGVGYLLADPQNLNQKQRKRLKEIKNGTRTNQDLGS